MISVGILGSKFEILSVFQTFVAYVETQFSTSIKILRSDSSEEYMSHEFHDFLNHRNCLSALLSLYPLAKWGG
jgi:hypothetical protein